MNIRPFKIGIPQKELDDLRNRIEDTRSRFVNSCSLL
jgi:hypothetical protein